MVDSPDCNWLTRQRYEHAIGRAFLQAFEESGLPPHPGGECPAPDCPCGSLIDQIEARAIELAAERLHIDPALLRDQ